MRKGLVVFLFVILGVGSYAQKYKDIFPQIVSAEEDNAFELLNDFLQIEPDHPNANLRIAKIYINRYKAVDVLREYDKALALAEQAKYKLIKAKVTVTDREVKRNEEYYMGILADGQFSHQAIVAYVDAEYAAIEEFSEKLPPIYSEFIKSVEQYDEVVKEFADIVGAHNSLKELYLLYDDELSQRMSRLKSNYDSTKTYFDNYLALRANYQVNAVLQRYTEKPIKVYRLDGLVTQIDFLQPNIALWDYATWVDTVNAVVSNNIKNLRADLLKNDKKLEEAISQAKTIDNPDSFKVVSADKSLIFNLMKYDYKNSLVPYLGYLEFKQKLLAEQRRKAYFDTASITVDRKLAYFNDMLYATKEADSIILDFESKYNPEQLARHQGFIEESFGSATNLNSYMTDEKAINKKLFMDQVSSIKKAIETIAEPDTVGSETKYRRITIPVHRVVRSLKDDEINYLQTRTVLTSADENIYVAGHIITDAKIQNKEIAIAKLSPDQKVLWLKALDLEIDSAGVDATHSLGDVKLTSEGVAFTIRSVALDSSSVINSFIHLTANGDIKLAKRIETELYPRELLFIERLNMYLLSFFGNSVEPDPNENSDLLVYGLNGLGGQLWQYKYSYAGEYTAMLTTQTQVLINGNFSLLKDASGRTYTKPGGTNSFILNLDFNGQLNNIKCYASDTNYRTIIFYKVSDRNLNLIGSDGEHLIVDGTLENIYSSVTLK